MAVEDKKERCLANSRGLSRASGGLGITLLRHVPYWRDEKKKYNESLRPNSGVRDISTDLLLLQLAVTYL